MKKMYLKMCLVVLGISLITVNLNAQGLYFDVNMGYGHKMSSATNSNATYANNSTTYEKVNYSFGKGINFGGACGYMFNKNVGAELGINYLIGGKTKTTDTYNGGQTDYTASAKMLRIMPTLVVASGLEGFNPYAKFGLVIGSGAIKTTYHDNDNGDIEDIEMKMKGGLAFGMSSALGAMFDLSDNLSLFFEFNMINMSYSPKTGEVTKATYNGVDELITMTTSQKKIEFVDEYTVSNTTPQPDSQPDQQLKERHPFGSFGGTFGCAFKLK
jgi:hypothetical protein